jgi:hypothetical protein
MKIQSGAARWIRMDDIFIARRGFGSFVTLNYPDGTGASTVHLHEPPVRNP